MGDSNKSMIRRSTWLLVVGGLLAGSTGAQREGRPAQDEEGGGYWRAFDGDTHWKSS